MTCSKFQPLGTLYARRRLEGAVPVVPAFLIYTPTKPLASTLFPRVEYANVRHSGVLGATIGGDTSRDDDCLVVDCGRPRYPPTYIKLSMETQL